jgi:hypothetical protein
MRLRNAVLTGVAGLMLNAGAGLASAQVFYREVPARRYYVSPNRAATHIVREAYRDILRREPDRSGLRQYVNAMLYEGWSEADVRRSLANSREYRQRFGRVGFWRHR